MDKQIIKTVSPLFGILMILVGLFVPTTTVIQVVRASPSAIEFEQLAAGVLLFKVGLVILGLMTIAIGWITPWELAFAEASPKNKDRRLRDSAILAIILMVTLAIRLYALGSGLWLDEILTYVSYAGMPFGEIVSTYGSENQHFLYSVLAHASFLIFGESAWSLRLPAVFFGVGSVWALYLLGCHISTRREAILSATLLAFTYHHVWFSQNARGYTGLLFWTLLSSWLLVRGLREDKPQVWLLYALATALGIYTHLTMFFVTTGQFIAYLFGVVHRRHQSNSYKWTGFLLGFCLAGLLTFQLHALVLPQVFGGIAQTESVVSAWKRPLWTLLEFIRGLELSFASGAVTVCALIVFGAGLFSYARTNPVLIQLLVIPPLLGGAAVLAIGHHLWPRFFFFTFGFGVLIVVRGCMLLGQWVSRWLKIQSARPVWIGTLFSLVLILISSMTIPFAYGPKQDYLGALAYVEARREPGDAIATVGLATFPFREFLEVDWEVVESVGELDHVRANADRTWLIFTLTPVLESLHPDIMHSIRRDFILMEEFPGTLRDGEIFVYISSNSSSAG